MDKQAETELLMHIAAGTDPLTALAALPHEDENLAESHCESSEQESGYGWIVFAVLFCVVAWMLF